MLEIRTKLKIPRRAYKLEVRGHLRLPFEQRQKSRLRATLVSGEEVALMLARGEILRGGDLLTASDGRIVEVIAETEKLLHVECADAAELARAAYHLGNRHVPVEVGAGYLRLAADHVLEEMLRGFGAKISHIESAFEPEAGAYGAGLHVEQSDGARIHEYSAHEHHRGHPHTHCDPPDDDHDHKH